jgi:hypothetical protein
MQLVLGTSNSYLIPSSALFSQGGRSYIFEVKDGVAHLVPVEVQVDDGRLAKIAMVVRSGNEEVKKELTGEEIIVASNQGELSDGQSVHSVPAEWK